LLISLILIPMPSPNPDPIQQISHPYRWLGLAAVISASTLWAIAANIASSLFAVGVNPFAFVGISAWIAALGLTLPQLLSGKFKPPSMNKSKLLLSLLFILVEGLTYLTIARLSVAVAVVLLFTAPTLVVLWHTVTTRKIPSPTIILSLLLSATGVLLVSKIYTNGAGNLERFGILIGLLAALCFASYTLMSNMVTVTEAPLSILYRNLLIASLFWLGYIATQGFPPQLLEPGNMLKMVYIGLAGNLLPNLLYLWGVKQVRAERAAIAATIEPVIAATLAWLWFRQTLTPWQILGGALILTAVTTIQLHNPESR
jgi:drug/metabolite transporter, DME family